MEQVVINGRKVGDGNPAYIIAEMSAMLTRIALLYKGSLHAGVRSTASICRAAAERNMAPILVGFTISSNTAILCAF